MFGPSQGGFLACLQGITDGHRRGISGMAVERDRAGKEVGGLCLDEQLITIFWLAGFAIVFLKAWQDSVLGFLKAHRGHI